LPSKSWQAASPEPTKLKTSLPSVVGDAEASLASSYLMAMRTALASFFFQRYSP
jgi:hypothetical protein